MSVYASNTNLTIVQNAITELVMGKRKVVVEYTDATGGRTKMQYTEVSLSELRNLENSMQIMLNPEPLMQSVDVEILF